MSTEPIDRTDASMYARLVSRQRPLWATVGMGFLLFLAPIVVVALGGMLDEFSPGEVWRPLFLAPVVIGYILIVAPIMARAESSVLQDLRPVVLIDDESYFRLVTEASRLNPIGEGISFGLGTAFGLWAGREWLSGGQTVWLEIYVFAYAALMFGLLGWTIFSIVVGTRLTAALHRQPLRIDLFDITPFESVGRQSLVGALVFVIGIVLAMIFGLAPSNITDWQNWLLFLLLALVPLMVFFLNMRETHHVLANKKKQELAAVRQRLVRACRTLIERIDANESTAVLAPEINALVAYEERLLATRTWPYDTSMLRTLFFSVIIPTVAALARIIGEFRFN